MDYEIPIGSGFTICIGSDRLDALVDHLRMSGDQKVNASTHIQVTNANATEYTGVYWVARTQRWRAAITVKRQFKHLGYFTNQNMAILARQYAEQQLGISS